MVFLCRFLTDVRGQAIGVNQIHGQHDSVRVGCQQRAGTFDELAVAFLPDKGQALFPDILSRSRQQDVAHQAAGKHPIRRAAAQDGFHHQKSVRHLGSAQHKHAGPLRTLHQMGDDAVFLFKQPAHIAGQQLFKPAQGGLIPVRGGKRVAYVQIRQRGQLADHLRL